MIFPLFSSAPACANCAHYFPSPSSRSAMPRQANFPIDAVYTWVDGMDPAHAAKRARHLPPGMHKHGAGTHLFQDNDELRYSLRSIAQYAPWVRHVHIVTDGQRPNWLRKDHPDLTVVDHREIIPEEYLPTFNSHVIEAYLHRIPNLAEHYIYFNDDFFLTLKASPGDFFTSNGLPHLFVDWRISRREGYARKTPHALSWWNTREELKKRGVAGVPDLITAHGPHPQTVSNAKDVFNFFAKAIAEFSGNRFRSLSELAFYNHAASLWTYVFKQAVPCDVPYWYINTNRLDRKCLYASLLTQKAEDRRPLFLCLNDVPLRRRQWFGQWFRRQHLAALLAQRWPEPSPYEK